VYSYSLTRVAAVDQRRTKAVEPGEYREVELTKAMQNTLRQSATVMAVSLHFVGYSNVSSSSAVGSVVELGREVFSPVMGWAASTATPAAGATVSTAPFLSSATVAWTLGAAVFSESVMLDGRSSSFVVLMVRAQMKGVEYVCDDVRA
jgi:hypothetical protein